MNVRDFRIPGTSRTGTTVPAIGRKPGFSRDAPRCGTPDAVERRGDVTDRPAGAARERGFTAFRAPRTVPEGPRKGNRNVRPENPDGIVIGFRMPAGRDTGSPHRDKKPCA